MRILFLVLIGVVVYLKFDAIVSLNNFSFLTHPGRFFKSTANAKTNSMPTVPTESLISEGRFQWSFDSTSLNFNCPVGKLPECLSSNAVLDSMTFGQLRTLIYKAGMAWDLPEIIGFTARYQSKQDSNKAARAWQIVKLDLLTAKETISIETRQDQSAILYCLNESCLDEVKTQMPISKYALPLHSTVHPASLVMRPLETTFVHPILSGRLVEFLPASNRLKIYHGKATYSTYSGFSELSSKLENGKMIAETDTLGTLDLNQDSLVALTLAIEKNGTHLDPVSFLGIKVHDEP